MLVVVLVTTATTISNKILANLASWLVSVGRYLHRVWRCNMSCNGKTVKMADFLNGEQTSSTSYSLGCILPPILSTSDRKFFDSLQTFIQHEKSRLIQPSEGPNEQRYNIYSSAFDKVIDRVTAYKMILSTIKKEYDDIITAVKRSELEGRRAQRRLLSQAAEPATVMLYRMRAAQLREKIAIIREDTTHIRTELRKLQESEEERSRSRKKTWDSKELSCNGKIPGLTLQDSINLATLQTYLEKLERKQADLQRKKQSQYVCSQVMADLETKLQRAVDHRDQLAAEHLKLELRHRKLTSLYEALSSWKTPERTIPLDKFLPEILMEISQFKEGKTDCHDVIAKASEEDNPAEAEESKLLSEYVERFTQLFEEGDYKAAALHAARSPRGILRNLETMERFKAVRGYEGPLPLALLYFQALMMSVPTGQRLPGESLAVEGVTTALQSCCLELVVHWVSQRRLTFSEALGDVISAHAQEDRTTADTCLTLAQVVYTDCELHPKAAVCMGRRGLISRAVEFICSSEAFTVDDCLYVVRNCSSVALLQALTQHFLDRPAVLPLCRTAHALWDTEGEVVMYQLLESMQASGTLKEALRSDGSSTAKGWREIAERCRRKGRPQLAQAISSALTSLQGVIERTRPPGDSCSQDMSL
ncbi:hypothetical protein GJAV_G00241700 [Gymnothorax javanicus]|nr:hypothetical protein GJAV_G00241700 [Gymnothorax javanicus]